MIQKIFWHVGVFTLMAITYIQADVTCQNAIPATPLVATQKTPLSMQYENAILLNGVKLNTLSQKCYQDGGYVECTQSDTPWRLNPLSPINSFGTGSHHDHKYIHRITNSFSKNGKKPVILGYAVDGFAIVSPYVVEDGKVRKVKASYRLKRGSREAIDGINPGGEYNGKFRDDYEYIQGLGDLDECNGMFVEGKYMYYVTEEFPYALNCFKGTPINLVKGLKEELLEDKTIAHTAN